MKKLVVVVVTLFGIALLMGGCAQANPAVVAEGAGFWRGLLHGFLAPFAFVVSLFKDDVGIYQVANNGGWYDFGFLLGVSTWGGGGAHGAHTTRRRRRRDEED